MSDVRRHNAKACLEDMLDCTSSIIEYASGLSLSEFEQDPKTQDAVLRRLEVLGEAAGRLLKISSRTGEQFDVLDLRTIYDMRNMLIHGYDGVDIGVVWLTAFRDIPLLHKELKFILTGL